MKTENKKPQNPSAFPLALNNDRTDFEQGMTLRDYFAAKAMNATLSTPKMKYPNSEQDISSLAELSYTIADAMLEQREL